MTWVIFVAILLFNTLLAVGVAGVLILRDVRKPGSAMMKWLFFSLALWTFFYAMITLAPSLNAKIFWLKMENIGIVVTPPFWFLFTIYYTKQNGWLNKIVLAVLFFVPAVTLTLLFSGIWFNLYYSSVVPIDGMFSPLDVDGVSWYYVQFAYNYILLGIGSTILLRHLFIFRNIYRKRALTLLAAFIIPVLLNLFYQIGGRLLPFITVSFDLAPISFTLTAILLSVAIFSQKLFETTPIAPHIILDYIVEMVLVVDENDYVLDVNQAAADWLGATMEELIGKKMATALTAFPKIVTYYAGTKRNAKSFHLFTDSEIMLEMTISPIKDRYGEIDGRVILLHNVAQQRQTESDLKKANEKLKARLAEIEILQAKLEEQAVRDPLTGLYNRRYLAEALDREIAQAERENLPISAIIMDVDRFKDFNDQHGHKCGDHVLEYLGKFLLTNTRRGDTVCRYGGEEFVILMPKVGIDVALARAETWRRTFANTAIYYDGQEMHAQFSAGAASYPIDVKNGEDLLKAADQALYYSKAHGRNCVTAYPLIHSEEETYVKY